MIISIFNQKGGVGKTTTAVNLAGALTNNSSKRVLVVDMDPQGNTTALFGRQEHEIKSSIYNLLTDPEAKFSEIALRVRGDLFGPGIHLVPGHGNMSKLEIAVSDEIERENLLADLLRPLATEYDFIIIDNAPTLQTGPIMSLVAANLCIIPMQAERLPGEGLKKTIKTIQAVKKRLNTGLEFRVLLTMLDKRLSVNTEVEAETRAALGDYVLKTVIGTDAKLKKGEPIFDFHRTSNGAKDYSELAREIQDTFQKPAARPRARSAK